MLAERNILYLLTSGHIVSTAHLSGILEFLVQPLVLPKSSYVFSQQIFTLA